MKAQEILRQYIDSEKAAFYPRFFKTWPGEYGEWDAFLGVTMPNVRKVAKEFRYLDRKEVLNLLKSQWHEERMLALIILTHQFQKGDDKTKQDIVDTYLASTKYINNWDLVDVSAHKVVGAALLPTMKNSELKSKIVHRNYWWSWRIRIYCGKGESRWYRHWRLSRSEYWDPLLSLPKNCFMTSTISCIKLLDGCFERLEKKMRNNSWNFLMSIRRRCRGRCFDMLLRSSTKRHISTTLSCNLSGSVILRPLCLNLLTPLKNQ